jgi:hypothetical protein
MRSRLLQGHLRPLVLVLVLLLLLLLLVPQSH